MANIILPSRWNRQPAGPVQVSPAMRSGLEFALDLRRPSAAKEIHRGAAITVGSSPVQRYRAAGEVTGWVESDTNSYVGIPLTAPIGTGDFTLIFAGISGCVFTTLSAYPYVADFGSSFAFAYSHPDASAAPAFYDGNVRQLNTEAWVEDAPYRSIAFRRSGTAISAAMEGRLNGTPFTSSANFSATTVNIGGFKSLGVGALHTRWQCDFAFLYRRALSDAELRSIGAAPYAELLAPINRRIWFTSGVSALSITPSGIAGAEAFGTGRLDLGLALTGIGSVEAFGTASLTLGQTVSAVGAIGSAEAFGTARLDLGIALAGLASAEAFGTARLDYRLAATGITTAEAFGTAAVNLDAGQSVTVSGIGSAEAFGTAGLLQSGVIATAAIASAEAFGTARLDYRLALTGAASAEAFGSSAVQFDTSQTVSAVGAIATAEAFGTGRLDLGLLLTAIPTAGAFGALIVQGGVQDAFGEPFTGSTLYATDRRIGTSPLEPGKGNIGEGAPQPNDGHIG